MKYRTIHERSSDGPEKCFTQIVESFPKDLYVCQTKSDVITSDQSQQAQMASEPVKTVKV